MLLNCAEMSCLSVKTVHSLRSQILAAVPGANVLNVHDLLQAFTLVGYKDPEVLAACVNRLKSVLDDSNDRVAASMLRSLAVLGWGDILVCDGLVE